MKISEILTEAKASRLPGAPAGIKITSPEEFAKSSTPNKDLDEAGGDDLLGAPTKDLTGQDFQDYMRRIATDTKTKVDKYKMPYVHRKTVKTRYFDEAGNEFSEEQLVADLLTKPKKILKQNEKMEHSNGEKEQYYNIGFAALVGIAVDNRNPRQPKPIIVNTCPGAGSCKIICFATGGSKIQFEASWVNDGRLLTWILNDPEGFRAELVREIEGKVKRNSRAGIKTVIRWHDSGDFFSPEYLNFALGIAKQFPEVDFYTYTKMASAILTKKPKNFIINWSEGAHTSQEKQIKMADPRLQKTKNSRIVPPEIFKDLLMRDADGRLWKTADKYEIDPVTNEPLRDAKGKLVKSEEGGAWQFQDSAAIATVKARIAKAYGLKPSTIITYDEMTAIPKGTTKKWNVIIAPGEGDVSANRHDVLTTLLLQH